MCDFWLPIEGTGGRHNLPERLESPVQHEVRNHGLRGDANSYARTAGHAHTCAFSHPQTYTPSGQYAYTHASPG